MIDVFSEFAKLDKEKIEKTYDDPGTAYCLAVLTKKQLAGYDIQLACLRHLRDLQHVLDGEFRYDYNLNAVKSILSFAAICPDVKVGKPRELMPWQKFALCQMFGWRNKQGDKRFSRVILSVARVQGKTYLCAIISCYSFLFECANLKNQDLMVTSNITDQAKKLYGYVKMMMSILLDVHFTRIKREKEIECQFNQILQRNGNNTLRQMSAESGKFDGFHFVSAVFDEAGETEHSEITKKITSGQVNVENKQFIQISTAYPDSTVPFRQEEIIMRRMMEEDNRKGDEQLCLVWAQDAKEEIDHPETWEKSNPLLGLPSERERLLQNLITERDNSRLVGDVDSFYTKNMNLWLDIRTDSYITLEDFQQTECSDFDIQGKDVYIGFDASLSSDNTAFAFVFPYTENGVNKYHIKQYSFIPYKMLGTIEGKEKSDGLAYRKLAKEGLCKITRDPTGLIDLDEVYDWLLAFVEENDLNVLFFGYDFARSGRFTELLESNTDWNIMAIRQRAMELSEPIKALQEGFVRGTVTHENDAIMQKALTNAILEDVPSCRGVALSKKKRSFKIDVVDALVDAMYQAVVHFDDITKSDNPYDKMSTEEIEEMILSGKMVF